MSFCTGCYTSTHFFVLKAFFRQEKKIKKGNCSLPKSFIHVPDMYLEFEIALYLTSHWYSRKNDLRQADNSVLPGVNHPCLGEQELRNPLGRRRLLATPFTLSKKRIRRIPSHGDAALGAFGIDQGNPLIEIA